MNRLTLLPLMALVSSACATVPVQSTAAAKRGPVLLVDDVTGLGLFADESAVAEAAVAEWAQRQGFQTVDVARANEVFALARAGKDPRTGGTCARPLGRWRATSRYQELLGAGGLLRTSIGCEGETCTLSLSASDRVDFDGERLAEFTAPFDVKAPWKTALEQSLAALTPAPPDDGGSVGGLMGGLGSGNRPVEAAPESLSLWARRAGPGGPDARDAWKGAIAFADGTAPLRACFDQSRHHVELLASFDGEGRTVRCESRGADDAVSRCACAAFHARATAQGVARGTRAFVTVSFAPADTVSSGNAVVTARTNTYLDTYRTKGGGKRWRPLVTDRAIEDWVPPADDDLERCFIPEVAPGKHRARVVVRFDAQGKPVDAQVLPAKGESWAPERLECVRRAFLLSRAPCPSSDDARAEASVQIHLATIGQPWPHD